MIFRFEDFHYINVRIGVITFHCAYNCGAMLQAWAMKSVLRKMGHEIVFPSCNHVGLVPRFNKIHFLRSFRKPWRTVLDFLLQINPSGHRLVKEDVRRLKYFVFRKRFLGEVDILPDRLHEQFQCLVYGSDQIWNLSRSRNRFGDESPLYLAKTVPEDVLKIAYAASIGEEGVSLAERQEIEDAAARLDFVSVREECAKEGLVSKRGEPAQWVVDPTLLLTESDYAPIVGRKCRGNYVVLYNANGAADLGFIRSMAKKAADYLHCQYYILHAYAPDGVRLDEHDITAFGPRDFLSYLHNAKAVLSCSFHGTSFALIFHKPFISLQYNYFEIESRQMSLLRRLKCIERLVTPKTEGHAWLKQLNTPVGDETYAELTAWRNYSANWLARSLAGNDLTR